MAKKPDQVDASVDPQNNRTIQFINKDIVSKGSVEIRLRGHQAFLESETGTVRIGSSLVKDKQSGELRVRLYAHAVEKREHASSEASVL